MDLRTSSSLQALPPPVEAVFLFFVTPYSRRPIPSDVGAYGTDCPVICIAGAIVAQFPKLSPAGRYVPKTEDCTKSGGKKNKQNLLLQ